jgi:hypothetical protein
VEKPSLSRTDRLIIGFHVMLAIIFAVVGVIDSAGGDGWSDLARFVTLLLAGIYLLAVGTISAIARYATANRVLRVLLLVFGPPALIVIAIFALRGV